MMHPKSSKMEILDEISEGAPVHQDEDLEQPLLFSDQSLAETLSAAEANIAELKQELVKANHKADDQEKKLIYLQADYQTYRRRRDEEYKTILKTANTDLIKSFLPIVDNLERALKAAEQTSNLDALVSGINGTLKQLHTFLQSAGVSHIEALGKEFDPNYHEAIGHAEDDDLPPNTVAEEVQRGYILHEKVLRPSLVKVKQD